LQTFLAAERARNNIPNGLRVLASLCHIHHLVWVRILIGFPSRYPGDHIGVRP
jgi:hypothetical protein